MALDLATICTDQDLLNRAGSDRVKRAKPEIGERDSARAQALLDVMAALSGRSPPIYESDLSVPTELHDAVKYRALQIIFQNAMTTLDSLHGQLSVQFEREYTAAIKRTYSVSGGQRGPSGGSFSLERR